MQIPYEVTARRDTGLFNAKIGIWLFLASEVMLFGGLFSAYVFLRAGVRDGLDIPWPNGADVHGSFVWLGFLNTLVLIASSVFVVMAWAQLKLRNWGAYKVYMSLVLICAGIFMAFKSIEYKSKFSHFGVRLVDGTLLDGELKFDEKHNGNIVTFNANEAEFSLVERYDNTYFLKFITAEGDVNFKHGDETIARSNLKSWLKKYAADKPEATNIKLAFEAAPVQFAFYPDDVFHRKHTQTSVPFFHGNRINGELIDDAVDIEVHTVDLQMSRAEQDSLAWDHLDEGYKNGYFEHQRVLLEEKYKDWVEKGGAVPVNELKLWQHIAPLGGHHGAGDDAKDETGGEAAAHHDYPVVSIPRDQIRFMSNHGPKFGPYFAIYFTMTGLHGLHVVIGALVLAHFLFFGKSLYLKNPEHLANRVEVGGLFWHFVDLVWIFLFPIMYLL